MVILEKIKEKHGQDNALTSEEQGLIASTHLPIEKFIMVDMELNSGIDFSTYAEVIADDILSNYLSEILTDIENLLVGTNYSPDIESQLSGNLHKAQRQVHDMEEKAYKKVENTLLMIEQSQEIERQVAANVSSRTKENMNFGGS
jgi:conjugative transfer pilus assembly protein TraH